MKSEEKFALDFWKKKNGRWVIVRFKGFNDNRWIPSFEDLFRIIRGICECEDEKYPSGRGRTMVRDFLYDCCDPFVTWQELVRIYQIPRQEGEGTLKIPTGAKALGEGEY